MKQILILHPILNLSRRQKRELEEAGFVVLIGDPGQARILVPTTVGISDPITQAALGALSSPHASTAIQGEFTRRLCNDILLADAKDAK